ncbi:hypothetical protein [Microlunatus parietis]|uniref:Uncharacterized protein n=1 Tax=Microlunatus parietis TaxID=682979 RepID=A0A7Y9LCY6_9ACTN|nr:hypothetical protein [Microlunatus parietis]NYE73307.1 hypothetical protein [Microlunatus parietis]
MLRADTETDHPAEHPPDRRQLQARAGTLRDSLVTCPRGLRDVLAWRTGFPDVTVLVELMRKILLPLLTSG